MSGSHFNKTKSELIFISNLTKEKYVKILSENLKNIEE